MKREISLSEKYQRLLDPSTRYHLVTGGRGSGKSFAMALALCYRCMKFGGTGVLFTRYTMVSAKVSIIPEFIEKLELLNAKGVVVTNDEITFANGSFIYFRGIKVSNKVQTASLKSISGVSIWVLDEAEELADESVFDKIDESIRSKTHKNLVFLVMNPATHEHWIYQRFVAQGKVPNCTYIHTDYRDNIANLDASWIQKAEDLKVRNPKAYHHRFLGQWIERLDGCIFEFEVGEFDDSLPYVFGLDFGTRDPDALVRVAVDEKRKRMYVHEELHDTGLSTEQLGSIVRERVGDGLVIADSAAPRTIQDLGRCGVNIRPVEKAPGSVLTGIKRMKEYAIVVTSSSFNLIRELNTYTWQDRRAEVPVDENNHLIDATRYAMWWLKGRKKMVSV